MKHYVLTELTKPDGKLIAVIARNPTPSLAIELVILRAMNVAYKDKLVGADVTFVAGCPKGTYVIYEITQKENDTRIIVLLDLVPFILT